MVTEQPKCNPIDNIPIEKRHTWKPGESGNPGGRPKDKGITPSQIEMMDEPCPYAKDPKTTWRQWLAEKGLLQLVDKPQAVKDYKDRVEGKVADTHKFEGDIPVSIVYKLKEREDAV